MLLTVPNCFTLFRIILIPVFALVFYLPVTWSYTVCACIFALAALTDWLDGYLARKLEQVSTLGAFIDPVADKLIVATALVLLVGAHATVLLTIPAAVIVGREIVISALREWMAEIGKRSSVAVCRLAKVKTVLQMVAITILLAQKPQEALSVLMLLGYVLLYVAAGLTLWSMVLYLRTAWCDLRDDAL